ncbi:unnamed protein product [marine sediment metagenome]|uniref:Uncharacterized protein n=1 Tax=marine sediment metagenome TaxID=412755 RepID=X1J9D8_9ZZZZ
MDVIAAINKEIFNHLRGNTEGSILTVFMGNKNIRVGRALRSDVFPYITFGIRPFVDPLMPLLGTGTLEFHLWDKNSLMTRINNMRDKLIWLMDLHEFPLLREEGEVKEAEGVRTFFDSSDMIEEEEEFIQHMVLLFTCKYIRKSNIDVPD